MANFCAKCGAGLVAGAKFCPECGAPAAEATGQVPTGAPAGGGAPSPAAAAGASGNTTVLLCYFFTWITGLIFLNIEPHKNDRNMRFHAWQALLFGLAFFAVWIVTWMLLWIMPFGMWWLISLIRIPVGLAGFVLWILLLIKGYNGEKWKLPIIGDIAEQQANK